MFYWLFCSVICIHGSTTGGDDENGRCHRWCFMEIYVGHHHETSKLVGRCRRNSTTESRSGSTSLRVSWCYPRDIRSSASTNLDVTWPTSRHPWQTTLKSTLLTTWLSADQQASWPVELSGRTFTAVNVKTYRGERSIVDEVTRLAGEPYRIECIDCVCVV